MEKTSPSWVVLLPQVKRSLMSWYVKLELLYSRTIDLLQKHTGLRLDKKLISFSAKTVSIPSVQYANDSLKRSGDFDRASWGLEKHRIRYQQKER